MLAYSSNYVLMVGPCGRVGKRKCGQDGQEIAYQSLQGAYSFLLVLIKSAIDRFLYRSASVCPTIKTNSYTGHTECPSVAFSVNPFQSFYWQPISIPTIADLLRTVSSCIRIWQTSMPAPNMLADGTLFSHILIDFNRRKIKHCQSYHHYCITAVDAT